MAENYKNDVEKLKHHLTILLDAETSLPAEQIGRASCRERVFRAV